MAKAAKKVKDPLPLAVAGKKPLLLSFMIESKPMDASVRGESFGNVRTLQKTYTANGAFSIHTGRAMRRAQREVLNAFTQRPVWRTTDINGGLRYEAGNGMTAGAMDAAVPPDPDSFIDVELYGFMIAKPNQDTMATKRRSMVQVSDAMAATPWQGTMEMGLGTKANGDLCPTNEETDHNVYTHIVTLDVANLSEDAVRSMVSVVLQSLKIGGGHSQSLSVHVPNRVMWAWHVTPACDFCVADGIDKTYSQIQSSHPHAPYTDINLARKDIRGELDSYFSNPEGFREQLITDLVGRGVW